MVEFIVNWRSTQGNDALFSTICSETFLRRLWTTQETAEGHGCTKTDEQTSREAIKVRLWGKGWINRSGPFNWNWSFIRQGTHLLIHTQPSIANKPLFEPSSISEISWRISSSVPEQIWWCQVDHFPCPVNAPSPTEEGWIPWYSSLGERKKECHPFF